MRPAPRPDGRRRLAGLPLSWWSLPLLLALWQGAAVLVESRFLPGPGEVARLLVHLTLNGPLMADFAQTLARAGLAFAIALPLGAAIGLLLGRLVGMDQMLGPWVLVGLNLPAIVVAIICYISLGLTETALVLAVVINKLPLVITTIRQGVLSFDPAYEDLAGVLRMRRGQRVRLIYLPQLVPFVMVAARTGLSLIWKIVLVFEVLGSDGGVGFRISLAFQYFDMATILAYTVAFLAVVLLLEQTALGPLERRARSWQRDEREPRPL